VGGFVHIAISILVTCLYNNYLIEAYLDEMRAVAAKRIRGNEEDFSYFLKINIIVLNICASLRAKRI